MPLVVVVLPTSDSGPVVDQAPADVVALNRSHHRDAVFVKSPLTPAKAMRVVQLREGVDRAWPGTGVVYFARHSPERQRRLMSRSLAPRSTG